MEIIPNSTVILLKGVPLESNYENTIQWTSDQVKNGTQETYFKRFQIKKFDNQYYQRKDKGSLKLECKMEAIYDCNYMMFRNTSFENKWFYAFVDSIDYINNITCQINYTIDIMQSWIGDYELNNCFVEREHSATDVAGDNLVDETFDLGEYVSNGVSFPNELDKSNCVLVVALNYWDDENIFTTNSIAGSYFGGVYQGIGYMTYGLTQNGITQANSFIKDIPANQIIGLYVFPKYFLPNEDGTAEFPRVTPAITGTQKGYVIDKIDLDFDVSRQTTLDGYIPKNNKLLTAPYNFLTVSNLQGQDKDFGYEYFSNPETARFVITNNFSSNPSLILRPINYKGDALGRDNTLELADFPQCAWTSDGFRQWVYNGGLLNGFKNIGTSIASNKINNKFRGRTPSQNAWTATGKRNIANEKMSIGSAVFDTVSQGIVAERTGSTTHNAGGSTTGFSLNMQTFLFNKLSIREEFARNIDGYFTMYGYATKRIKKPNRCVRNNCTYVKTIGCTINGSVPAEDERAICDIHDNGIRYWNGTNVFNNTVQVAKYLEDGEYITNATLS